MLKEKIKKNLSKVIAFTVIISNLILAVNPQKANAGITDSVVFEPMLGCAIGGAAGYATSSAGQEILMTAAFCGGGALLGILLNMHYSSKFNNAYQHDISEMRRTIKEMELQQAMRSASGEDENYSLRIRKVIPGQKLPNGSVTAPTIVESLITPGETVRVGD